MEHPIQTPTLFLKSLAALTAAVALAGLGVQLALIIQNLSAQGFSWAFAVWRYLGFFTILTNFSVAIVAAALALQGPKLLLRPVPRLAVATSIILVGLVYSVALRNTWQPTGWQAVADHMLHDATPPLFAFTWLLSGHGQLAWRDAGKAVAPALAYFVYALARGRIDGWYAYWFLDPSKLPPGQMAISVGLLMAGFGLMAVLLIGLDRWPGRKAEG